MNFKKKEIKDISPNFYLPKKEKNHIVFIVFFILLIFFGIGIKLLINSNASVKAITGKTMIEHIYTLFKFNEKKLKGEKRGIINILLLGVGGQGHQGPYLTDTIILTRLNLKTKDVALISIPRDLYIKTKTLPGMKINAIYAYGRNKKGNKYGIDLLKKVFKDKMDLEIDYYILLDFKAVKNIIDAVQGIDIYVERSFVDKNFPTDDFGTTTVVFEKGWHHMNGEEALIFARSRHGNNNEGSDFARMKRQQKILLALKEKLGYFDVLNYYKVLDILKGHFYTDINLGEAKRIYDFLKKYNKQFKTCSLSEDNVLISFQGVDQGFYLMPKNNNFDLIEQYINLCTFNISADRG